MVVRRLYSDNVIVNDYVVPAVKCRDIPMVVRRLYSGNVIINDYVVLAVKPFAVNLYTKHAHATNYISEAILCFVVMVMYCMLVLLVGILIWQCYNQ
jgi:hypothetical protein